MTIHKVKYSSGTFDPAFKEAEKSGDVNSMRHLKNRTTKCNIATKDITYFWRNVDCKKCLSSKRKNMADCKTYKQVYTTNDGRTMLQISMVVMKEFGTDGQLIKTTTIDLRKRPSEFYRRQHSLRIIVTFKFKNLKQQLLNYCKKVLRENGHVIKKGSIVELRAFEGVWVFPIGN